MIQQTKYSIILIFAVLCFLCNAQKVGLKGTISWGGLAYLKDIGITELEDDLSSLSIPDIDGTASTPIGDISYDLTAIVMTGLSIPESNATLVPPSSVILSITNAEASMTLNWHYRENAWPHISDSGTADVKISSTTIAVELTTGIANGRPTATTASCSVDIGNLDIDLHGGASWLYDLFINLFSGQIKSQTESQLQSSLPTSINQGLATTLSTLPITENINSQIEINYELQDAPRIFLSYFTLDLLGEFYAIQNPSEAPFSPAALPDTATSEMAQIFISDFNLNSASYVLYSTKQMETTITDSQLPPDAPLRLNTTYFTELIPPLQKAYPNHMFNLFIYATETPVSKFTPSGATVAGNAAVNVVILPENVVAFTLGIKIVCSGDAGMTGLNVTGKLTFLNASLSLLNSSIGTFDVSTLQSIVNTLIEDLVIPQANKILANGYPLPTITGLKFISPTIGWGNDYLYVSTNFNYLPPTVNKDNKVSIVY